jgi:predicted Zn-dependent peptidase
MMEYQIAEITPGCQLIYKQISSPVSHIAVFNECGTRHESDFPEGIAHFLEHMIFKGTTKRKTYHILSGLENNGCDINAFTSKEEMVIHASFLEETGNRIIGLIAEILFESVFPENEIEKERNVIIDEIASIKDSPADLLFEHFEKLYFGNHALGSEILGNKKSLKKIHRNELLSFYNDVFLKSRKVIVYYGNKSFAKVHKLICATFGQYVSKIHLNRLAPEAVVAKTEVFHVQQRLNTHQTHALVGAPAYDVRDDKKNALGMLINILGGQAFNSRLNLLVREKLGLSYSIDAFYNLFADNGFFSIYFSTENGNAAKVIHHINREMKKMREQKIGSLQLHIAKKQLIGQTAISLDSAGSDMLSAGKVFLYTGKIPGFEDLRKTIESITAEQLIEVANEVFVPEKISTLIYEPK